MKRKFRTLIFVVIISLPLTSCSKEEKKEPPKSAVVKVDESEGKKQEVLTVQDILKATVEKDYTKGNYNMGFDYRYHFKSEELDLLIDQTDKIYHYQDGEGRFKTVVEREESGDKKQKMITYDKDLYVVYDSDLSSENLDIDKAWENIFESRKSDSPGIFTMDSSEEFEEFKNYSRVDYPENPLVDSIRLLEMYQFSDMYRIERLREKEDETSYVLNMTSIEEDLDIIFYIDIENYMIKEYSGTNKNTEFSGKIDFIEEDIDYGKDFFKNPRKKD